MNPILGKTSKFKWPVSSLRVSLWKYMKLNVLMYFTVLAPQLKLLLWYCWYFFFSLLFFSYFPWMLWSLDRIKERNCLAMLTSKDSYKSVGERKRNSQADPKRITFLPLNEFCIPVGGMSTKESFYFILKIYFF